MGMQSSGAAAYADNKLTEVKAEGRLNLVGDETMRNYYNILEISPDADSYQIKSAFRKLAKKFHPDITAKGDDNFRLVKEAFDIISNPEKRWRYDKSIGLHKPLSNDYRSKRVYVPPRVQDVYDDLLDVFADRFYLPRKRVLEFELYLNDNEFVSGARTSISIPQEKICPNCFGFGGSLLHICRACQGSGLIEYDIAFDVVLKPPLKAGQIYEMKSGSRILRFSLKRGDKIG